MRRLLRRVPSPIVLAAAITLAAAVAAGAYAATGTGSQTVHGCVTNSTRVLYLAPCHNGDTRISWNKVGPAGPGSPSVVGSLGPDCTQAQPSTSYTVTTNGTEGCSINIPGATFSRLPVLLVTPEGNETVTGIGEAGKHSTSWILQYTLSTGPGPVNFAAVQESP